MICPDDGEVRPCHLQCRLLVVSGCGTQNRADFDRESWASGALVSSEGLGRCSCYERRVGIEQLLWNVSVNDVGIFGEKKTEEELHAQAHDAAGS